MHPSRRATRTRSFAPYALLLVLSACGDDASPQASHDAHAGDSQTAHTPLPLEDESANRYVVANEEAPCGEVPPPEGTLLDVGHQSVNVSLSGLSEDRLLAVSDRRWILWDTRGRRQVASGPVRLNRIDALGPAGGVMITPEASPIELRDARDGKVLRTFVPPPATSRTDFGLTPDGAVVWATDNQRLTLWHQDGRMLAMLPWEAPSKQGVLSDRPLVHRGFVHVPWLGTIRRVRMTDGEIERGPSFAGRFKNWFPDGSGFVTSADDGTRVYDLTGLELHKLPGNQTTGGFGGYVWTRVWRFGVPRGETIEVRRLGQPEVVAAKEIQGTVEIAEGFGSIMLKVPSQGESESWRLDLTGPEPRFESLRLPVTFGADQYVSDREGNWALNAGLLYARDRNDAPGVLPLLGCGPVVNMAGSRAGRVAVATGDGRVRVFERASLTPTKPILTLAQVAESVELSEDGERLFVRTAGKDAVRVFSIPDGALVQALPRAGPSPQHTFVQHAVSRDGSHVALLFCAPSREIDHDCEISVHDTRTQKMLYRIPSFFLITDPSLADMQLSPSGKRLSFVRASGPATAIFEQPTNDGDEAHLVTTLAGQVRAFIDEDQVFLAGPLSSDADPSVKFFDFAVARVRGGTSGPLKWFGREGPGGVRSDGERLYFRGADVAYAWPSQKARFGSGDVDGLYGDLVGDAVAVLYGTLVTLDEGWSHDGADSEEDDSTPRPEK